MTPLKQPITVTFDCVERAVLFRLLAFRECTAEEESRIEKLRSGITDQGKTVGPQIEEQLIAQGINFYTWEPAAPIRIGSHTVEFKSDAIQVGCKTVPHETVRVIAARLEQPPVETNRKAIINVHGDETLGRIVQEFLESVGFGCAHSKEPKIEAIGVGLAGASKKQFVQWHLSKWDAVVNWDNSTRTAKQFDARKDFGAVLDFFRQPSVPEIQIGGEAVKFNGNESITFAGETVSRERVREIVKRIGG